MVCLGEHLKARLTQRTDALKMNHLSESDVSTQLSYLLQRPVPFKLRITPKKELALIDVAMLFTGLDNNHNEATYRYNEATYRCNEAMYRYNEAMYPSFCIGFGKGNTSICIKFGLEKDSPCFHHAGRLCRLHGASTTHLFAFGSSADQAEGRRILRLPDKTCNGNRAYS